MSFWQTGFWQAGFWSAGFWGGETAIASPGPAQGGGLLHTRQGRRRRLWPDLVEVDQPPMLPAILPPDFPPPPDPQRPLIRARQVRDAEDIILLY
ncbi:MAG: hypothetical protein IT579_25105 [Verrucomicrobia subdivision 3 bacterium]|nr:hypothetical protein [Limisphaerales bacterium]